MLEALLFGELAVSIGERPIAPVPGLRPRALLAWLLVTPGLHPRARVAGLFWPEVLDTSARASLRSALWTIRAALQAAGGGRYLHADRTSVGITPGLPRAVDVEEFDRLVAVGDRGSLERAVVIARMPLLADLADEWALDLQDAYRERLVGVIERLADAAEEAGDTAGAVRWSREAVSRDRLRESAHRDLMRRLAESGERAQALGAYRRLRDALAGEVGIPPSEETRRLARAIRDGPGDPADPHAAPAGTTVAPPPGVAAVAGPREPEARMLSGAWTRAARRHGGVVSVSGPAGFGKTHLLRALARTVEDDGGLVATGAALDLEGAPPLAPWAEAIGSLVAGIPAPDAGWGADLVRLCPAAETQWGIAGRAPSPIPELERLRLFEAVTELLRWAGNQAPTLVVLEDLHRSDPVSCALLAHAGRRLERSSVLIAVSHRPAPLSPALTAALEAIGDRGALLARVELAGLPTEALAAIAGEAAPGLDPRRAGLAAVAAGGSPLLAVAAARAMRSGEDPVDGLRGLVRTRLGRLSRDAVELVEVVAAAGRPLDVGEAAEAAGPAGLRPAFEEARAAGLLTSVDGRVGFVHELLRQAFYEALQEPRRRGAHRRLARGLARRPTRTAAELARHHRRSGDDAAAVRFLAEAAREARGLGAVDEAATYLAEALEAAEGRDAAELALSLAEVHSWRADRTAMDAAFTTAVTRMEHAGDRRALAGAYAFRSRWLHTTLCHPAEALAASRRARELADGLDEALPEARLLALASGAWAEAVAGDPEKVAGLLDQARRAPEAMGDRALEAELEQARGVALVRAGRFPEAAGTCVRAAALAYIAGRPDERALALLTAATATACTGDMESVLGILDEAAAGPWPGRSLTAQLDAARAYALSHLGRHDEAVARARMAAGSAAGGAAGALADFDLGSILLAAGRGGEAAKRLREALGRPDGGLPRALARLRLAEAEMLRGDAGRAAAELGRVPFEPVGAADAPEALVARLARVQGLIAAARGDAAAAARRYDEAERTWRRLALGGVSGDAFAAVLVDLGRPPVAGLVEPAAELARLRTDREALSGGPSPTT